VEIAALDVLVSKLLGLSRTLDDPGPLADAEVL
jgi:hypothetical protein